MTLPSVTIQSFLVFTAKQVNQIPTITFTNGATAGFEVVTVSGQNITVQIQSGVTTMAQVVTAINAQVSTTGYSASQLVSVSAGSHGSTAVVANDGVLLSGGVALTPASLTIGGVTLVAVTGGTAGNAITLHYTTGATAGSEMVSVSSNDITVQIADAAVANPSGLENYGTLSSTSEQVAAAINAYGAAAALVTATANPAGQPVFAAPAATAVHLTGGLAAAAASTGAVNGVTVVANATGSTANGKTVNFTPGGTAGAEVVTLDASNNVFVQIQDGTSTVTQIVTALQAYSPFTALYTASGSASTHPPAVYQAALSGGVGPTFPGSYGFYTDQSMTTLTTSYQYLAFGNVMGEIIFNNDDTSGSNKLSWSWDGINVHGIVAPTQAISLERCNKSGVYVKYVTGSPAFRITSTAQ